MALPPKKNIDFDVYERQDPTSTVDWGKAAADITQTFAGIRDKRQARKDDLEKNITEQQAALNDIGEYDSPTLRQVALDSSQQSADELAIKADQMRRGLLRPNDLMKFKSNQSAGWTQFKNNAEAWDGKFKEFATRTNEGLNSSAERELAEMVSTFGNLKNMKFLTDDDGNMAYARVNEKGDILPGESVSANEMTNLLNQKIDTYNATDAAKAIGDKIGVVINSTLTRNGIRVDISTEERARAESDFFTNGENTKLLNQFADEMTANPRELAVMMVDSDLTGVNGVKYQNNFVGGPENGEDKHAKWAEENSDADQSLNPYIKWEWNGNSYEPSVSEEQRSAGNEYAKDLIQGTFNIKQTDKTIKIEKQKDTPKSGAEIQKTERDDKLLAQGKNLFYGVTGNAKDAEAGLRYISDASNGNISRVQKTADGFIIQYPPRPDGTPVDPYEVDTFSTRKATKEDVDAALLADPNSTMKLNDEIRDEFTPKESMRVLWKASGLSAEFDAWLAAGGEELLEGTETTRDKIDVTGPQTGIKYNPQAKLNYIDASGNEVTGSAADKIANQKGGLGNKARITDGNTNAQVIREYSSLLDDEDFYPTDLGLAKITMDGDDMTFVIDGKDYPVGQVFGYRNGMTTIEIVKKLQEIIKEAIGNRKDGGNSGQYDKKKEDE
jgi:hypothetical protein